MIARLLIVEDNHIQAMELKIMLQLNGYEVIGIVNTGEMALTTVRDSLPDIILMDINLAGELDGISTAEEIKSKLQVPVILMSGDSGNELRKRLKRIEHEGFFEKPVQREKLLRLIRRILHDGCSGQSL